MAQQGAVFEQAFAASSWTRPSVSTIHTSLDPIAHGNLTFGDRVADAVDTLAETLAAEGYLTASFVTNYHGGGWSGLDQGFDEAHEATAHGSTRVTSTLTSAAVADPIDRFLTEHEGERVFVFVQSLDPHAPYEPLGADHYAFLRAAPPTPADMDPTQRQHADLALRYDAEILHNDRYLERLDATLETTGRAPRTLFVFASDHGEAFGEHGQVEHRKSLHQEELHVPWVLRWPGVVAPGRRIDAWAGHIDMAPTLLGLVGLEAPTGWGGRDLSSLLTTRPGSRAAPDLDRPLLVHMVHDDETRQSIAVVWEPYKLVMPLDETGQPTGPPQLLDLAADPDELQPLPLDVPNSAGTEAARALEEWARRTLAESRASSVRGEAEPMSPAMREWMRAMGYL
jgi:arylsulfatase A-like enzyme